MTNDRRVKNHCSIFLCQQRTKVVSGVLHSTNLQEIVGNNTEWLQKLNINTFSSSVLP